MAQAAVVRRRPAPADVVAGRYLTDGRRLLRVVSRAGAAVLLEDCAAPDGKPELENSVVDALCRSTWIVRSA